MEQSVWEGVVARLIIELVLPGVGTVCGIGIALVLKKLKNVLDVTLSTETEKQIRLHTERIVQAVAEDAAAKFKWNKVKVPSDRKLYEAVYALCKEIPSLSEEKAQEHVKSALARISGEGATGDMVLAEGGTGPTVSKACTGVMK